MTLKPGTENPCETQGSCKVKGQEKQLPFCPAQISIGHSELAEQMVGHHFAPSMSFPIAAAVVLSAGDHSRQSLSHELLFCLALCLWGALGLLLGRGACLPQLRLGYEQPSLMLLGAL